MITRWLRTQGETRDLTDWDCPDWAVAVRRRWTQSNQNVLLVFMQVEDPWVGSMPENDAEQQLLNR